MKIQTNNKIHVLTATFIITALTASVSLAGYVDDAFPDSDGTAINGLRQWTAATDAIVSNNAAYLPASSAATNTVNESPISSWTDIDIIPTLGKAPSEPRTNTASALSYFDADGYLRTWNETNWTVCDNDVWGNAVTNISAGDSVRISIYQNYTDNEYAIFLNQRLLIQNIPFPAGSKSSYTRFTVMNASSNAVFDNVWIQTIPTTADSNYNHIATADIIEMQNNGYVARTLYVPGSGNQPSFATIAAASAAARDGDRISVAAASYSESVTITNAITFIGGAFTTTAFTVNSAVIFEENVTITDAFTNNASVTFNGTINTPIFTANADITLAGGADLNATTLLDIGSGATITGTSGTTITTPDLNMVSGTLIDITNGAFSGAVELTGTFTIDGSNWADWDSGSIAAQSLTFTENFDTYTNNSRITDYGLYGWGASSSDVKVQNSITQSGSNAMILPDGTSASNKIDSGSSTAIWTVTYMRPVLGKQPASSNTTGRSFMSYIDTNGFMVVYTDGGWSTCSNKLDPKGGDFLGTGGSPATFDSDHFKRIAVYQDFAAGKFSLFIDNASGELELVAQQENFPGTQSSLNRLLVKNNDDDAYLDSISIGTTPPSGSADLDNDGMDDILEIDIYGSTLVYPPNGTVFKFR